MAGFQTGGFEMKVNKLKEEIRGCVTCKGHLPNDPNPVFYFSKQSRIVIIGQAPGRIVEETGIAWNDKSGDNLRKWLGVGKDEFYDESLFATVPMGFCYPGTGKSGDMPPRPECAPQWHEKVLAQIVNPAIVLLIGKYAQDHYLKVGKEENLTETVRNYRQYLPKHLPLPHPSPRNNIWVKRNEWFEKDLIPDLRKIVRKALGT
jgi:uracil-DNA glycosylase